MNTPILVACGAVALLLLYIVWRMLDARRQRGRRDERKARNQRRRAHQYAWDIVMRRNGTRRLTDQRERRD